MVKEATALTFNYQYPHGYSPPPEVSLVLEDSMPSMISLATLCACINLRTHTHKKLNKFDKINLNGSWTDGTVVKSP